MAKKGKKKRPPARRVSRGKQTAAAGRPAAAGRQARRDAKQAMPDRVNRRLGVFFDLVLAVIVLVFIVRSAGFAGRARFLTDECLHTYITERIVEDGISPIRLSALYSGMRNNTHPLFHWVAAPFDLAGGRAALPYVNVVVCGVMLAVLYWILRAWAGAAAARIAVAAALLFDAIYICTQIFYAELLSALTFMLAVLGLYVAFGLPGGERPRFGWRLPALLPDAGRRSYGWRMPFLVGWRVLQGIWSESALRWKLPFLAGCATGLCLLAKQTGYVVLPVLVVLFVFFLVTWRWRRAIGVVIAALTAVATFAVGMNALSEKPLVRFRVIYASVERAVVPKPFRLFRRTTRTPVGQHDEASGTAASDETASTSRSERVAEQEAEAREALQAGHGHPAGKMFRLWLQVLGVPGLILLAVCLAHLVAGLVGWIRRMRDVNAAPPIGPPGATSLLLLSIVSLLASAIAIGTADNRHFVPMMPVLAACTGIAVSDLSRLARRWRTVAAAVVTGLLLVFALVSVALVPNYREPALGDGERKPSWVGKRWKTLGQNAPQGLIDASNAIRDDDTYPTGAVHSGWTAGTWYYSGHPSTWGSVNVPNLNSAMLLRDQWHAFRSHARMGIRYYLIYNPAVDTSGSPVPSAYTPLFFGHVADMLRSGTMRIIYPAELVQLQDQLLSSGSFDRVFLRPPNDRAPAAVLEMTSGQRRSVPREAIERVLSSGAVIWGNPGIPYIVVKLDYNRFWFKDKVPAAGGDEPELPDR